MTVSDIIRKDNQMSDAIGAIFGHHGAQRTRSLEHLRGTEAGAATMAYQVPPQFSNSLFPGGKLPEEPKHC